LYKEDFNKFVKGLVEAVDYVKTELMPDFDFDAFNHDTPYEADENQTSDGQSPVAATEETVPAPAPYAAEEVKTPAPVAENNPPLDNGSTEEVDKW
jgi:hypothetical protein